MTDCDLIIVGGGPAGLAHAFWRLRAQPQLRVHVVEAAAEAGGWLRTTELDGFQLEHGPQGFRPDDATDTFLAAAGLEDEVVACSQSALRRFVIKRGRLHELPSKPRDVLRSRLISMPAKLRLLWETRARSVGEPGESVASFVQRRFGRAAVPVAEAMMHGIFAGDAHALEVASALPTATALEREFGSLLKGMGARAKDRAASGAATRPAVCTFRNGMAGSVEALTGALGDVVRTGARVDRIARTPSGYTARGDRVELQAPELCVTAPPPQAAHLLRPLDAALGDCLAEIPSVSVVSSYLGFERSAVPEGVEGFGFLAPQGELGSVLGAIYASSVFPHQAPEGHALFRIMSGGHAHPHEVDRSDEQLLQQASDVLRELLGIYLRPSFRYVSRARAAIPQYISGHDARMRSAAASIEQLPGLTLRGAGYRKISIVGQWAEEGSTP